MKKIFACILTLCPMIASADYLDDKIASLTKEKLDKIAKLEECQKSTKGLKIAGITTLGVSAIGIGANIGEAVKLNKLDTQIGAAETNKSDLDRQISAAKEEKAKKEKAAEAEQERQRQAANNTCGNTLCTGVRAEPDRLNAKGVTCVNNEWKAVECKENFPGTPKSCKSNGVTVTYYENCTANAAESKTCSEITSEWLAERHAKAGACDTTIGQNYITECADNSFNGVPRTTGNKQGYEKCEKSGTEPVVPERKYHEHCTTEETEKIPNAMTSWWYNGKCVARSCKPNTYLHVKNGVSQGQCKTACPAWQIIEWANGGQACDVEKQKQNCNRKVYGKDEYTSGQCQAKCEEYANESTCNLTGNAVEITSANQCVCNPVQSDVAKSNQVTQENKAACAEKMFTQVNARNCDALCKKYAAENNCDVHKSGSVTTTNMVACYCNPADTVTLDGPNRRAGGFGAAAGVLGGF